MRYNIFNEVHRPLKLALLKTCINLSDKKPFDMREVTEALKKVDEVLAIFNEQVKFEDGTVLPLVFEYEPSIWDIYVRQHEKQMCLARKLDNLVNSFRTSKDEIAKWDIMILIDEAFNELILSGFNHMDDEEQILNKIL